MFVHNIINTGESTLLFVYYRRCALASVNLNKTFVKVEHILSLSIVSSGTPGVMKLLHGLLNVEKTPLVVMTQLLM
jgi:hypothetical protein